MFAPSTSHGVQADVLSVSLGLVIAAPPPTTLPPSRTNASRASFNVCSLSDSRVRCDAIEECSDAYSVSFVLHDEGEKVSDKEGTYDGTHVMWSLTCVVWVSSV